MAATCPVCATENIDNAKFCKGCGHHLLAPDLVQPAATDRMCAQCGAANHANARFCRSCGMSMARTVAHPTEAEPDFVPTEPASLAQPDDPWPPMSGAPSLQASGPAQSTHPESNTKTQRRPAYALWSGVGTAVLILAGVVYWFTVGTSQPADHPATAAVSEMPVPAPAPVSIQAPQPAPAPASDIVLTTPPTPRPDPKSVAPKPLQKPVEPRRTVAPAFLPTAPQSSQPQTATAPVPASPPAPRAAPPAGPSSPQEVCGNRVFIALAMCISEQCQAPRFTQHPQCVKLRQQREERQNPIYAN